MKQLALIPALPLFHGGKIATGRRKIARPLATKRPLHLVIKARRHLLLKSAFYIEKELRRLSAKFQLTIYSVAINTDHLHIVLKILSREKYKAFIRSFTGILARKLGKKLWALLPFTRVLTWGRDFRQALRYLQKNRDEVNGLRPYEPRKNWYKRFESSS